MEKKIKNSASLHGPCCRASSGPSLRTACTAPFGRAVPGTARMQHARAVPGTAHLPSLCCQNTFNFSLLFLALGVKNSFCCLFFFCSFYLWSAFFFSCFISNCTGSIERIKFVLLSTLLYIGSNLYWILDHPLI